MADELEDLRARVREWLRSNLQPAPAFALPQNALTVQSEQQLDWLRAWQARIYDAGFVGVEWPTQYGGRGLPRGAQRTIDQELARAGAPFLVNNVALAWAGPMILHYAPSRSASASSPSCYGPTRFGARDLASPARAATSLRCARAPYATATLT